MKKDILYRIRNVIQAITISIIVVMLNTMVFSSEGHQRKETTNKKTEEIEVNTWYDILDYGLRVKDVILDPYIPGRVYAIGAWDPDHDWQYQKYLPCQYTF